MTTDVLPGRQTQTPLVIAISGSSGFLGSALFRAFEKRGGRLRRIVRRAARTPTEISWDPEGGTIDAHALAGVDAVIHLAGENLAQRWTDDAKRRIRESRVNGTLLLARTLAAMPNKPQVLLSGSAIGVYGDRGDEALDESSTPGTDFLASVCTEWETATAPAMDAGIRVVQLRTGLVMGRSGGMLPKLLLPFRLGLGGRIGSGRQWLSWIALSDYVDALAFLLRAEWLRGPVNLVSANPVTNAEFTNTLARVLARPALVPVPAFAVRFTLGELGEATVLASQRVAPRRLTDAGFEFALPTLEAALRFELRPPGAVAA